MKEFNYKRGLGLPYMGSKRKIASDLVDFILKENPNVDTVYDLFGGGGAMTFEFVQRRQIKKVVYNDLDLGVINLIKKIINDGVTDDFYKWVTRDEFKELCNGKSWISGLVKICWSFGNQGNDYLYGKEIEPIKKMFHDVIVYRSQDSINHLYNESGFRVTNEMLKHRKLHNFRKIVLNEYKKFITNKSNIGLLKQYEYNEHLARLQNLERLQLVQDINSVSSTIGLIQSKSPLDKIEFINGSYDDVVIPNKPNVVIYLDPPYENTKGYQNDINHKELWQYINKLPNKVYISSYNAPYKEVFSIKHRSLLNANDNTKIVYEKLFLKE